MNTHPRVLKIAFVSPIEHANPENDNIDVHVHLEDGRVYSFLVATPSSISWSMDNEMIDYYFGTPPLFVRLLNRECIEKAVQAILSEDSGRWLDVYGALQE